MQGRILGVLVALMLTSGAAWGQSTDRSSPSPWTSYGINGHGTGSNVTYYYRLTAGPGVVTINVQCRARVLSTGVTVDLIDETGAPIGRGGAIATGDVVREATRVTLRDAHTLLMAINVPENTAEYSVWLDGPINGATAGPGTPGGGTGTGSGSPGGGSGGSGSPGGGSGTPGGGTGTGSRTSPLPWTSYGINGNGDGSRQTYWYAFEAGPGDLTVHVQARARVWSTSVTADLYDESGSLLGRVGSIATGTDVHEQGRVPVRTRQRVLMRVEVDANAGPYSVWIDGPVHR